MNERRFQKESSYPDEQLRDDHVSHGAGQVQGGTSVSVPVRLVDLFFGAVGQQENHQPQVVLHHGPQELLSQRHVWLRKPHQEQLLLVLRPDPALLLFPEN